MTSVGSQDNAERRPSVSRWIAIIPLIGSALAYAIAFVHEVGYCSVFHIPAELITLNWTTVLLSVATGAVGLFFVGWLYYSLFIAPRFSKKPMGSIARRLYFIIVIFGPVLFLSAVLSVSELMYVLIGFITIGLFIFFLPLLDKEARFKEEEATQIEKVSWYLAFPRRIKLLGARYREILEAYDKQQRLTPYPAYFMNVLFGILIIVIILGSAYVQGRKEAVSNNEFYVPSTNENSVVLRIYGDNLICAPFVRLDDGIGISRRFFVTKLSETPDLELIDVKFNGAVKVQTNPLQR